MAEAKGGHPHFQEVRPDQLSKEAIESAKIVVFKTPTPDTLYSTIIADKKGLLTMEAEMMSESMHPEPLLERGYKLAREDTNDWLEITEKPKMDHSDMPIALLDPVRMDSYFEAFSGTEIKGESALGFAVGGMNTVAVKAVEDMFNYVATGYVRHELQHRWGETQMNDYAYIPVQAKDRQAYKFVREARRGGLQTSKEGDEEVSYKTMGLIPNELPNYKVQRELMKKLLNDPAGPFSGEARGAILGTAFSPRRS